MALKSLKCTACGASVTSLSDQDTVRCEYCGTLMMLTDRGQAASANHVQKKTKAEPSGTVLFSDDFSDSTSGWPVGKREWGTTLAYVDGAYSIRLKDDDSLWESFLADKTFADFDLEVELAKVKGPKDGEYGVVCRASEDGSYMFWITNENYYGIAKIYYIDVDDEEYIDLVEGEDQVELPKKTFTKMRVVCKGAQLSMYLDGKLVVSVEDDEFSDGELALMLTTGESDKGGLEAHFKNLIIRQV